MNRQTLVTGLAITLAVLAGAAFLVHFVGVVRAAHGG